MMKVKNTLIFLTVFLTLANPNILAQFSLKKISKAIDKAGREIDKQTKKTDEVLVTNNTQEDEKENNRPAGTTQDYRGVTIKSSIPQIEIMLESCIREGKDVTVTYRMKNKGANLDIGNLGMGKQKYLEQDAWTTLTDNLGNSYQLKYLTLVNKYSERENKTIDVSVLAGAEVKGTIEIAQVKGEAKILSLVIAGMIQVDNRTQKSFSYSFDNLPIYDADKIQQAIPVLAHIDNPPFEKQAEADVRIKSVTITDKNTKVDLIYTNNKFDPRSSVYIDKLESCWIEIDGVKYKMISFSNLGKRTGEVYVGYKKSHDFTVLFEMIPQSTIKFDLYVDGWDFSGVRMKTEQDEAKDLLNLADNGDANALYILAMKYKEGDGVLKNPKKANDLLIKSGDAGNAEAQYVLGMMYKENQELAKAFTWLEKSSELNNNKAQYELGLMYYYAKGTTKNTKKAAYWIEKAYEAGNSDAEKTWTSLELWKYQD